MCKDLGIGSLLLGIIISQSIAIIAIQLIDVYELFEIEFLPVLCFCDLTLELISQERMVAQKIKGIQHHAQEGSIILIFNRCIPEQRHHVMEYMLVIQFMGCFFLTQSGYFVDRM